MNIYIFIFFSCMTPRQYLHLYLYIYIYTCIIDPWIIPKWLNSSEQSWLFTQIIWGADTRLICEPDILANWAVDDFQWLFHLTWPLTMFCQTRKEIVMAFTTEGCQVGVGSVTMCLLLLPDIRADEIMSVVSLAWFHHSRSYEQVYSSSNSFWRTRLVNHILEGLASDLLYLWLFSERTRQTMVGQHVYSLTRSTSTDISSEFGGGAPWLPGPGPLCTDLRVIQYSYRRRWIRPSHTWVPYNNNNCWFSTAMWNYQMVIRWYSHSSFATHFPQAVCRLHAWRFSNLPRNLSVRMLRVDEASVGLFKLAIGKPSGLQ